MTRPWLTLLIAIEKFNTRRWTKRLSKYSDQIPAGAPLDTTQPAVKARIETVR